MKESLKQNYNRHSKALFACVTYQELAVTIFCKASYFLLFSLILSHFANVLPNFQLCITFSLYGKLTVNYRMVHID